MSNVCLHVFISFLISSHLLIRNRDFQEVTLERDGETLLQFAAVYGFRNIQTLVHRMRKGRVPYQLVEVLSCPGGRAATWFKRTLKGHLWLLLRDIFPCLRSGCLSGRGQAESEAGRLDKNLIQQMEEVYSSLPVRLPEVNPALHTLYHDWLQGQDSPQANILLHTQYKNQNQSQSQPPHMQWWDVMESLTWTVDSAGNPFIKDNLQLGRKGALFTYILLSFVCQTWNRGPVNPEKKNTF